MRSNVLAERLFHKIIPGQFGLAFVITAVAFIADLSKNGLSITGFITTLEHWQRGFWDGNLMIFTLQMILILVFGYSIAISPIVYKYLKKMAEIPSSGLQAALLAGTVSMAASWLNWGLGLVAGAIFVRLLGHSLQRRQITFNYPLLGAAGYSGMMIWHGGLSGSATLKAAESGHLKSLVSTNLSLPDAVAVSDTIFSLSNSLITLLACISVLALVALLALRFPKDSTSFDIPPLHPDIDLRAERASGAEVLEFKRWPAHTVAVLLIFYLASRIVTEASLNFFNPNVVITFLLAFGLLLHGSLRAYMLSIDRAIQSASGVLLLFPFYFGIIGLLRYSGLTHDITQWFVSLADQRLFPIFVFLSSSIVNLLIPSGGGQWAVQGPIILEAGSLLGISPEQTILSFAYGDQLTNMLQPFWAIPLLYITRIKASDLIGYTFFIMLIGLVVFFLGILLLF
ncbi:short-chain fatty acids transporter [Thermaurantimonas aggregans]|uniref:Short-chain fatty acids transporter n=2 Tax=Thermaurantimonas aggregans TaxID=2173829 RepID=A0A401XJI8_9FLAO|nr:TIGR00366 family protein [Thermaurantimonas aggregans]GCD77195.1 short-chain fatty acids transporter [Thermaurantimonas aggregans]